MPNPRQLIMMVDDSLANLAIVKNALSDTYTVLTVSSAVKMLELLERHTPELILLDVDMPEMNGYEAIQIIKKRPKTRHTPVIFLTAMGDAANELEGLSLGAVDYITKPFSPPLLQKRVEMHLLLENQKWELREYSASLEAMVAAKTQSVLKLQNKLLTSMAELVEGRDSVTGSHIERTKRYLNVLLAAIVDGDHWPVQSSTWDVPLLLQSSQLHDVGKITISDAILKKPHKLTPEEFETMKSHVVCGVSFIEHLEDGEEDSRFLQYARTFAAYHHERWNGAGYPYGLAGENIPLLGRIMAIADVYDALTSERPYKKSFSHEDSFTTIMEDSGGQFDPALVKLFEQESDQFRQIAQQAQCP